VPNIAKLGKLLYYNQAQDSIIFYYEEDVTKLVEI